MADYPTMVREMGYQEDIGAPITGLEISPRAGLGAMGSSLRAMTQMEQVERHHSPRR